MKSYFVVTGIVKHKDKILILKKSPKDYNYPNKWSFCSGYVKEFESAEESVLREIKEETGLNAKIIKSAQEPIVVYDKEKDKRWVVLCFLCEADKTDVKLCHENVDFKWVTEEELKNYDFVPGIEKDLKSLGLK